MTFTPSASRRSAMPLLGVLRSASLAVCMIGQGLAAARGLSPGRKHATKQVDRLLSNSDDQRRRYPCSLGALRRRRTGDAIVVVLDWTDFDADKQATIMLSLVTDHAGVPHPWYGRTVDKCTLKNNRSRYEHRVLVRLAELPLRPTSRCAVADLRLRRPKTLPGDDRGVVFRLRHPLPRRTTFAVTATTGETRTKPLAVGCDWADAHACCAAPWSLPIAMRWELGGSRSGPGHEARLVSGRQQHRCHRQAIDRLLRPSLGH